MEGMHVPGIERGRSEKEQNQLRHWRWRCCVNTVAALQQCRPNRTTKERTKEGSLKIEWTSCCFKHESLLWRRQRWLLLLWCSEKSYLALLFQHFYRKGPQKQEADVDVKQRQEVGGGSLRKISLILNRQSRYQKFKWNVHSLDFGILAFFCCF